VAEARPRQTLRKSQRLTRRKDISRVFRRGRRVSGDLLRLHVVENSTDQSRLAVAVSTRYGNAVRRNRAKRLCREAFRSVRAELPAGYDYVIVPLARRDLSVEAVREALRRLSRQAVQGPPS